MRLLLADDHTLFRSSLRSLLEARGVEVVGEASDGRQAVQLAARLRPDLVVAQRTKQLYRKERRAMDKDFELQREVLNELDFEPSVNAAQIGVAVKGGVVTLTGFVDSYAEKVTAEKAIKSAWVVLSAALFLVAGGLVAATPPATPATAAPSSDVAPAVDPGSLLPNGRQPLPGVLTGGQPSREHLAALAAAGYKTLINLRSAEEKAPAVGEEARELGLRYVELPVAGAQELLKLPPGPPRPPD